DEGGLAPGNVGRVGQVSLGEDAVMDPDRVQVAGPDAEQGEARRVDGSGLDLHLRADPPSAPQQLARGEQQRLPPLGTTDIAKQRLVAALTEPVAAALLEISHPAR